MDILRAIVCQRRLDAAAGQAAQIDLERAGAIRDERDRITGW